MSTEKGIEIWVGRVCRDPIIPNDNSAGLVSGSNLKVCTFSDVVNQKVK